MKAKQFIITIFSLFILSGCADFLDEKDQSNFTPENYFTKPEHAESIINAIYEDLRLGGVGGDYGGNPYFMTDFQTGLAGTKVGQNTHINNIRLLVNNADNGYSKSWWNTCYRAIANANMAIEKIPGIEMDETLKAQYLGEAYFFRAYNYFNLIRIFGHIPLILSPVDASSSQLYPMQEKPEVVYDQIVKDLVEAEKAGLDWVNEGGRVNQAAVKSVLAEVYLTMAGYPMTDGSDYYQLSAAKAKEVIDHGDYYLFDDYSSLHSLEYENKGEHIFMIQYQSGIVENPFQSLYLPYNLDVSFYSTETGSVYAMNEFIDSYEDGDKRIENEEFYYDEYTSNKNRTDTLNLGAYYIYKFFDTDANLNTAKSSLNYPLIRYAEVLLMFAEASNEVSDSPSDDAFLYLNKIRERANLEDLSGLTKNEFRKAVWKEQYYELAFENKVWFNMVRIRKVLNLRTGNFDDYVGHEFVSGPVLTERELLFPIPTSEINNNKNLVQNTGY